MTHIHSLPNEILLKILIEVKYNCALVCKRWYRASQAEAIKAQRASMSVHENVLYLQELKCNGVLTGYTECGMYMYTKTFMTDPEKHVKLITVRNSDLFNFDVLCECHARSLDVCGKYKLVFEEKRTRGCTVLKTYNACGLVDEIYHFSQNNLDGFYHKYWRNGNLAAQCDFIKSCFDMDELCERLRLQYLYPLPDGVCTINIFKYNKKGCLIRYDSDGVPKSCEGSSKDVWTKPDFHIGVLPDKKTTYGDDLTSL